MKRPLYIWLAFAICLAVVLAAMAYISAAALRSERMEQQASTNAAVQEKIRLALWRMDSALTPLITQESARPYFTYAAFYPLDRAYTRMFAEIKPDDILVPSPLLTFSSPMVLLHFQFTPQGELTSPQVPTGNQCDLAETGYATHEQIMDAQKRLAELKLRLRHDQLLALLPKASDVPQPTGRFATVAAIKSRDRRLQQMAFNASEFNNRVANFQNADSANGANSNNIYTQSQSRSRSASRPSVPDKSSTRPADPAQSPAYSEIREAPIQAAWVGDMLILAQRVNVDGHDYVHGCWLDWQHVRQSLLDTAKDILPHADLVSVADVPPARQPVGRAYLPDSPATAPSARDTASADYLLAALPAKLLPGPVNYDPPQVANPVSHSLLIAWACLLTGAGAVALLLQGVITLSQRRGAFVSAVTHELRTPLTTFRLYSDMLAGGMVTDPQKRAGYLNKLRDEADRLGHLVENVLAYARLSGPRHADGQETITLAAIVDRSRERLAARALQAQMTLAVEFEQGAADTTVRVNASAVEQILTNLLDNACKFAGRAQDPTIHLQLARTDRQAIICVKDHGPGISKDQARQLFREFCKSAHQAANSAPGVGLGLALSRRLARNMHGDLRLDQRVKDGAAFVLSLPAV